MLLDFDPEVVGVASQPFWLHWAGAGGVARRHVPDYFARLADGSGVVVDVRPEERVTDDARAVFEVTEQVCQSIGWGYRRVGRVDPVLAANVRWLSGYRHPRCMDQDRAEALLVAFGAGRELADGVAQVGDPIAVLPVLFHLLWSHALLAGLDGERLGADTVVVAAGVAG